MPEFKPEIRSRSNRFIRSAIENQVFKPVQVRERHHPTIVLACGGNQNVGGRVVHVCQQVSHRPVLFTELGGAAVLDPEHPENRRHNVVKHIFYGFDRALEIKRKAGIFIRDFVLVVDYECGMEIDHQRSVIETCLSDINAKKLLKRHYQEEVPLPLRIPDLRVRLKFYLEKPHEVLGEDHPLVLEHPHADGLTFYFSSKEFQTFVDLFDSEEQKAQTVRV